MTHRAGPPGVDVLRTAIRWQFHPLSHDPSCSSPNFTLSRAPSICPIAEVKSNWLQFLQRWLVTTVAVLVATKVVRGIHYTDLTALLLASLGLGLLNAFVRPMLLLVSIGFVVATLGLGILVINALLLWGVGSLGPGFRVEGFWAAFWGALVISIVSFIANLFLGQGPKVVVQGTSRPQERSPIPPGEPPGKGPVIDV